MEEKQSRINDKLSHDVEELRKRLEKQGNNLSFAALVNLAVTYGLPEVEKALLK